MSQQPDLTKTGGDRRVVVAVVTPPDHGVQVLRYAALVASIDACDLRVVVLRPRLGFRTEAALVAARRSTRRQVLALIGDFDADLIVEELVVNRRTWRDHRSLWSHLVLVGRSRRARALVVPFALGSRAPQQVPGLTVVSVFDRPGRTHPTADEPTRLRDTGTGGLGGVGGLGPLGRWWV